MPTPRAIIHADLDAFFAAVEQRDNPDLRGKPVIVGGPGPTRGVVATASYEARRFGVASAMPIIRALRLCPEAIIVPPSFGKYEPAARQVHEIFERYTPDVELISIDEAFLDVTLSLPLFGTSVEIAQRIQQDVQRECGLTISIGVSGVKSVSKVASDLQKPRGLTVVPPGEERAFLAPLPIERLWGVGPRTAEVLHRWGLRTIGELAAFPKTVLVHALGVSGRQLHALANAQDPRRVHPLPATQSVGKEQTFMSDIGDTGEALHQLAALSSAVATALRVKGALGRIVSVKLRTKEFVTFSRQKALEQPTDNGSTIYAVAKELFLREVRHDRHWRLLGVSVGGFANVNGRQLPLPWGIDERQRLLEVVCDQMQSRFGRRALYRAIAGPALSPPTPWYRERVDV